MFRVQLIVMFFCFFSSRRRHTRCALVTEFRRVLFRSGAALDARIAAPCFRMAFGAVSILAGPADGVALDRADPDHPSTSLLAASLPRGWRESGDCWIFIPENPRAAAPPETTRMREFFKMMVLLIDLFDASHIFWSPARLWSRSEEQTSELQSLM